MLWDREGDDSDRESLELFGGLFNTAKPLIVGVFLAPRARITPTDARDRPTRASPYGWVGATCPRPALPA